MAAREAAAMPFPREETTPPVMKMYLVMRVPGQMFFVGRDDTVKRPAIKIQSRDTLVSISQPSCWLCYCISRPFFFVSFLVCISSLLFLCWIFIDWLYF